MFRYINTFTRYMWLLLVPVLAAPLLFVSILTIGASYTSSASLWVEQPLYLTPQRAPDGAGGDSPSQQTATMLRELTATRAFLGSMIQESPLKTSLKSEAEQTALMEGFSKNLKIEANGWRLISLSYKSDQSKRANEVLDALVSRFKVYYDDRIRMQSQNALSFYQTQIQTSTQALDKANDELKTFLAAHPNTVNLDGYGRPLKPEELEYVSLTQNRDLARRQYDEARQGMDKVQASFQAFQQGQDTYIRVQDKPEVTSGSSGKTAQLIIGVAVGLVVGLLLTVALTVILTLLDRTMRQPGYASQMLGVSRVLEVPNVSSNRSWSVRNIGSAFVLRRSLAKQLQATEARRLRSRNL